jgi:hypothetical protein
VRTVAAAKVVQTIVRDIIVDIQRGELAGLADLRLRDDLARSLLKNRHPALHAAMVQSVAVYGWLL